MIKYEKVPATATYYGLKFGYINNIKPQKKIGIRFESDILITLIYTEFHYDENYIEAEPVLAANLYYGPNFNIRLFKNIDLSILGSVKNFV